MCVEKKNMQKALYQLVQDKTGEEIVEILTNHMNDLQLEETIHLILDPYYRKKTEALTDPNRFIVAGQV